MKYFVTIDDQIHEVRIEGGEVWFDGTPVEAEWVRLAGTSVRSLRLVNRSRTVVLGPAGEDGRLLHLDGARYRVDVVDERTRRVREMTRAALGASGPRALKAPMPGLVVKVEVAPGDRVVPGQGVIIVEAMKMENELRAEADGVVAQVLVSEGQPVEKDQVLVDFAPPEEADES